MKTTIKDTERIKFEDAQIGDTFIDNLSFSDNDVLMRIDCCPNVTIVDNCGYAGYAVNLSNGKIYGYKAIEKVYLVKSELTATR